MADQTLLLSILPWTVTVTTLIITFIWLFISRDAGKAVTTPGLSRQSASATKSLIDERDTTVLNPLRASTRSAIHEPESPNSIFDGRRTTFRVRRIPGDFGEQEAITLLSNVLELKADHDLQIHSFAMDATRPSTKIATIDFERMPLKLFSPDSKKSKWEFKFDDTQFLLLDTNFLGLTTLVSPPASKIKLDIIAISGLDGHAFYSFQEKDGNHMWLRDSLHELDAARILVFGHDSHLHESDSFQDLEALGRTFLGSLKTLDKNLVPKVLIGHSLGGLIIKQSIILMQANLEARPLLEAIRGIMFFGVPSQGLDIRSLIPMVRHQPNELFLHNLGTESQLLREQCDRFVEALKHRHLKFVGFYETKQSPTAIWEEESQKWRMNGPATIFVGSSSARHGLSSETVEPVNKSHSELAQFSRGDSELDRVLVELKHLGEDLPTVFTRPLTNEEQACLRSLWFPEMENRRKNVAKAADKTCEWIRRHPEYLKWQNGETNLLWISGNPGSGKSTLFKHVLENSNGALQRSHSSIVLSFLFHGRGADLEKSRLGLYRSLSHQLFIQIPDACRNLLSIFTLREKTSGGIGERWTWHVEELHGFLQEALRESLATIPVQLFVDALDEAGEENAKQMFKDLKTLAGLRPRSGRFQVSICFTCRRFPILPTEDLAQVCIEDQNMSDINIFVDKGYPEIKERSVDVYNKICQRAQGIFQWADLVSKEVSSSMLQGSPIKQVLKKIEGIPTDLKELYQRLLESLNNDERDEASKLIQWICYAKRPLTLAELRFATILQADDPPKSVQMCHERDSFVESDSQMLSRLKYLSRGLAETESHDQTGKVQFIHQSVKDYFLEYGLRYLQECSKILIEDPYILANHVLSWACIHCIKFQDFKCYQPIPSLDDSSTISRESEVALAEYAVRYLLDHLRSAHSTKMTEEVSAGLFFDFYQLSQEMELILQRWLSISDKLWPQHEYDPESVTTLHIISEQGLVNLFPTSSIEIKNIINRESDDSTPLSLATSNGHTQIVRLLLDYGAKVSGTKYRRITPLHVCTDAEIARLLLDRGAKAQAVDYYGNTPLHYCRVAEIVKLLLTHGADVRAVDKDGRTPLHSCYDAEVVKALLAQGADVMAVDKDGQTPLHFCNDTEIAKLLLTHGADVRAVDKKGQTSLHSHYNAEVVKALLAQGADVMAVDKDGQTPLHVCNDTEIAKLLLTHGADVRAVDKKGQTPLHVCNDTEIAKLLLTHGADVRAVDKKGQTPLHLKVVYSYDSSLVKLLLNHGAEVSALDKAGRVPLHRCTDGEIAQILLDRGAKVTARDKYGLTPLHFAVSGYRPAGVVGVLLNNGAEVSAVDKKGWTPLHCAATRRLRKTFRLLLLHGADIAATNCSGHTPLHYALKKGHKLSGRSLVQTGRVDLNTLISEVVKHRAIWLLDFASGSSLVDIDEIFRLAIRKNYYEIVVLLLEIGKVNVNSIDVPLGQSALIWGSQFGYQKAVKVLLDSQRFDFEAISLDGITLVQFAHDNRQEEMEKLLTDAGANVSDLYCLQALFAPYQ